MSDAARIAALEAALEDVLKRLDPQTLRQALERTYDPRGGEPRIIDENGVTLDYAPAIQFLGSTTELNVPAQRVVVTPASGTMAGIFSPDASVSDAERIKFVDASDGVTRRYSVDTSTAVFGTRSVTDRLSETGVTTGLRAERILSVASGSGIANHVARAAGSNANNVAELALQADGNSTAELNAVGFAGSTGFASLKLSGNATAGASSAVLYVSRTGSISGASKLEFDDDFLDLSLPAQATRRILGLSLTSHFMQAHPATNNETTAVKRVTRGPFTVPVTALGAGASVAGFLGDARNGSDYVVVGGPDGAAGSEGLRWSWTSSGSQDVTINVTNDSAGPLTATLRFYVISTA